jgi:Xaa-Pro dipeptidase
VEPGIYFIDYLLEELRSDPARAPLINWPEVERFRSVGGIRIEDNVVITDDGCRVLTDLPRTTADIEAVMSGRMEWVVGKQYREYHNC